MSDPISGVSQAEVLVSTTDRWECVHFVGRTRRQDFLDLRGRGFLVTEVGPDELSSSSALFGALSREFQFPDYFGENWDAVADCLGDLEWLDEKRFVLLANTAGAELS